MGAISIDHNASELRVIRTNAYRAKFLLLMSYYESLFYIEKVCIVLWIKMMSHRGYRCVSLPLGKPLWNLEVMFREASKKTILWQFPS